jgi:hypothetical protein
VEFFSCYPADDVIRGETFRHLNDEEIKGTQKAGHDMMPGVRDRKTSALCGNGLGTQQGVMSTPIMEAFLMSSSIAG